MSLVNNSIVEDYLTTAKMLIDMKRADGAIPKGYSATLLLLCATDALATGCCRSMQASPAVWTCYDIRRSSSAVSSPTYRSNVSPSFFGTGWPT